MFHHMKYILGYKILYKNKHFKFNKKIQMIFYKLHLL